MSGRSSINECQKTFNVAALSAALKTYLMISLKQYLKNEIYSVLTDMHLWRRLLVVVCTTTLLDKKESLCIWTHMCNLDRL